MGSGRNGSEPTRPARKRVARPVQCGRRRRGGLETLIARNFNTFPHPLNFHENWRAIYQIEEHWMLFNLIYYTSQLVEPFARIERLNVRSFFVNSVRLETPFGPILVSNRRALRARRFDISYTYNKSQKQENREKEDPNQDFSNLKHEEYQKNHENHARKRIEFGHTTPAVLAFKVQCVVEVGFAS